jgi:hypothetical protein
MSPRPRPARAFLLWLLSLLWLLPLPGALASSSHPADAVDFLSAAVRQGERTLTEYELEMEVQRFLARSSMPENRPFGRWENTSVPHTGVNKGFGTVLSRTRAQQPFVLTCPRGAQCGLHPTLHQEASDWAAKHQERLQRMAAGVVVLVSHGYDGVARFGTAFHLHHTPLAVTAKYNCHACGFQT